MPDRYGQYRLSVDTPDSRHVGRQTAVFRGCDERATDQGAAAVAIKTVSPLLREPEVVLGCGRRLLAQKEVQAKIAQHSAHWLPVLATATADDGSAYAVEPWRPGTLKEQILAGPSSARFTHGVVAGVLQGLVDIRATLGRGHGNIKSTNILLDSAGSAHLNDPAVSTAATATPESEDLQALARLLFHWVQRYEYGAGMRPDAPSWAKVFGKAATAWQQLFLDLDSAHIATAREALARTDALRPRRQTSPRLLIGGIALAVLASLIGLLSWQTAGSRSLQAKVARITEAKPWVDELLTMEQGLFPTHEQAKAKWQDDKDFDPSFKARLEWLRTRRDLLSADFTRNPGPEKVGDACKAIAELEAFFEMKGSGGGPAAPGSAAPGSAAPWSLLQELRQEAAASDSVFPQQTRDAIRDAAQSIGSSTADELCRRIITLLLSAHARPAYQMARGCAEAVRKEVLPSTSAREANTILHDKLPGLVEVELGKDLGSARDAAASIHGDHGYNLTCIKTAIDNLARVRRELADFSTFIESKKKVLAKEEGLPGGNRLSIVEASLAKTEYSSLREFLRAWRAQVEETMLVHEKPEEWLSGLKKVGMDSPPIRNLWAKRVVYAERVLEDRRKLAAGALSDDQTYLTMRAEFARLRSFLEALDRDGSLQATLSPPATANDVELWPLSLAENYLRSAVLDACCPEPGPEHRLLRSDLTTPAGLVSKDDADKKLQEARKEAESFSADMRILHGNILQQYRLLTEEVSLPDKMQRPAHWNTSPTTAAVLWNHWKEHPILAGSADAPPAVDVLRALDKLGQQDANAVWKALVEAEPDPGAVGCWALVRAGCERLAELEDWPGVDGRLEELAGKKADWAGKGMPDVCRESLLRAQVKGTLRLAIARLSGQDCEAVQRWLQPDSLTRPGDQGGLDACLNSATDILAAAALAELPLHDWAYSAQELAKVQTPPSDCKARLEACLTAVTASRKLTPDPRDLGPLEDWLRKIQADTQDMRSPAAAADAREPNEPRQRLCMLLKDFEDGLGKLKKLRPVAANAAAIREQQDALEKLRERVPGCLDDIGKSIPAKEPVLDEIGTSVPVTAAVKVEPAAANRPPEARNDALAVDFPFYDLRNTPSIPPIDVKDLLANDTDPDGDQLSVPRVDDAQFCTATLDPNTGRVNIEVTIPRFMEQVGLGPVLCTFAYTISDGRDGTSQATVGFLTWLPKPLFDGTAVVTRKKDRLDQSFANIAAARKGLPDELWGEIVSKWSAAVEASRTRAASELGWPAVRDGREDKTAVNGFVARVKSVPKQTR